MIGTNAGDRFDSPYPGLRPFEPEEADIFFGRAEQLDEMLAKLEVNRFPAVVGTSGCGKSSLVRAGLLPAIAQGFLSDGGPNWRSVVMRPGDAPIAALADELSKNAALGAERGSGPNSRAMLLATLRRGRRGLVDAVRETHLPEGTAVLILVDQFEELFRYQQRGEIEAANALVSLLLNAAQQRELPIYVIITMRSDFLGDCSAFERLPEAINDSQFLTPRLTRDQQREAIVGPARLFGCAVEPAAVNCILNEMGRDPDQLPLMQHALMRVWWNVKSHVNGDIGPGDSAFTIQLSDYEATGGLERALSIHANEAYEELPTAQQHIAEILFRCITDTSSDRRGVRRPVSLGDVASVAGATADEVAQVVDVFRKPGRSFLTPPTPAPLRPESVLDISHESLIRQWERLVGKRDSHTGQRDATTGWLHKEAESASIYRRLVQTVTLWKDGKAALWGTPDIELARKWKNTEQPTAAWAARYGGSFDLAMEFLDASVQARRQQVLAEDRARIEKATAKRRKLFMRVSIAGATFSLILAVFAWSKWNEAEGLKQQAQDASEDAERERQIAVEEGQKAKRSAYNAKLARFPDVLRNNPAGAKPLLDEADANLRDFTWHYFYGLARQIGQAVYHETGAVNAVAFSADGRWMATAGEDGTVKLWRIPIMADMESKPVSIANLEANENQQEAIRCLAFSPLVDSHILAFAGQQGTIWLWDVESDRPIGEQMGHGSRVRTLAFSDDGTLLASGADDEMVRIWDVKSQDELCQLEGHSGWVSCVTFLDRTTLASASYDTMIKLWDIEDLSAATCRVTLERHMGAVYALAAAQDHNGGLLASGGEDGTVRIWNVPGSSGKFAERRLERTLRPESGAVYSLAFSADVMTLASANEDGTTTLWDVGGKWPIRQRLSDHVSAVYSVAYSSAGGQFASAGSDGKVHVRNASQLGESQITFSPQGGPIDTLAFSPTLEETTLVSITAQGSVEIWDTSKNASQQSTELKDHGYTRQATCAAYSPDGKTIALGDTDGRITLWDLKSNTEVNYMGGGEIAPITSLVFHPSVVRDPGIVTALISGHDDGTVRIWDRELESSTNVTSNIGTKAHEGQVTSLAFSPDGTRFASASADQRVKLWNSEGELVHEFPARNDWVLSVAFSHDGKTLAAGGDDNQIKLWNVTDLTLPATTLDDHTLSVTSLAFSPKDGRTLASASMDNTVMLWDPVSAELRATLRGHTRPVLAVAFRADGKMLASTGDDGSIRLWIADRSVADEDSL